METKKWYASKTVWVNLIAVLAGIGSAFGLDLSPDVQAEIGVVVMGIVNLVLRFVTKAPVAA